MENAWEAKCAPTLASASSSVASSVQVPSQISKNQIETNLGYCIQLHDVRQSRFQDSAMTHVSPSQQSDFQHESNRRVLSSSYPANFRSAALTSSSVSIPNRRLTHDYNHGFGVDVSPLLLSRVLASSGRTGVPFLHRPQDSARPSVTHAGFVQNDSRNAYFTQEAYMVSSNASSGRMPHGSKLCTSKKSHPVLSSFHRDQPSPVMGSSRVFCMNKSGDLLLSNTGLLAVVCSCHGLQMSISNFCEHSGFSNAIPGYAVHMDTGETLAQWRKVYFSKHEIRIPEDHKGWEWPAELLPTLGIPRCSAPDGGIKCSGFSDRVCTSVEPECTTRSYNNFFAGYPHLTQKQIAAVSQVDQPGDSYYQHNIFSAGLPVSPKSNMHNKVNDYVKACPSPNGFTLMKSLSQGGLCNGGQLISSSCNMVSQTGNSYSESLGGLIVKAQTNENISVVPERGATSSCIELKLGQPSEKCRSLEFPAVPAVPLQISDPRKIISQQGIIYTISAPGETNYPQYTHLDTGLSSLIRTEKKPVSKHAFVASITNMLGNIETSNNDLSRHSRISALPTYLATSSGGMSYEKITIPPNDGHHFIPWTHNFQHQAVKSGQICIAGGTASTPNADGLVSPSNADGAIRPSDKSACLSSANKSLATGHSNSSLASSETSFQLYAKQMEKMGFFNGDTHGNYQFCPVNGKNQLSSMVPNILDTSKPPEESGERNCKSSAHVKNIALRKVDPSTGFGLTFPSQESYMVMPPTTANPAQSLKYLFPNEKELCFGPSKLGKSLRNLALVDPAKYDEMNALLWSNTKLQSGGPDLKIEKPNFTYKSSMSESTSKLFSPVLSCQVNNNVGISSSTSVLDNPGANLKNLTACRNGFTSYYGETSKLCHGCHDALANGLPLKGAGNEATSRDTCKKCSQRVFNMKRCICISDILVSNKESEFGGTSSTSFLKKQSPSSEAFKICALRNHIGHSPEKKSILVENGKVKGLMHEGLESSISQLIGVPTNIKGDCRLMCTHELAHGIGRKGESGSKFKDFSAENDPRSSKIDDSFKGNELNTSSGCSGPTARQVSVEESKAGSSIVDTEDPVYESDQIVDQGSAVDKCFLPDDATLSQTSSEHLYSSAKIKSIRDRSPKSSYNSDWLNRMNEHKQCNILRIREVQNHGLACVKRKRRTNWTTLSTSFSLVGVALSPYEFPSDRGDPPGQQYRLDKNGGMLSKSLEDSSDVHQDFSRDPSSKWRKTALSLLQRCSCRRHLDMDSDIETIEDNSETELNNKLDSLNLPDIVAVKKLKQDNSAEVADRHRLQKVNLNNARAVLKSNLVGFTKENYDKQEDSQWSKMKPIVCGMYGIISSRETILRLPKIFSLSHVLKTARKCEVEPQLTSVKESKKRSLDDGFCSFGDGKDSRCNKFRPLSRNVGTSSRGSDETSSFADCPHPSGWYKTHKQGLDKTKTNNISISSIWRRAQFKPKFKAVRRRNLYELFMEGEKLSSKDKEDSKNICCTLPNQCTYEMKTYENVGNSDKQLDHSSGDNSGRFMGQGLPVFPQIDSFCCVCGKSNEDQTNCLLECSRCSIRIHQACYGISRLPKGHWYCRPCSTNSVDTVCVLCGYEGGAMTRALRCDNVVKSLLKAWNIPAESGFRNKLASSEAFQVAVDMEFCRISTRSIMVHNSVTAGLFDPTVKQWIHMVCGLWTPGTRCPNVDTMSSFDVSGVSHSKPNIVCVICKRRGGSSIKCCVLTCSSQFHPWCAHLKGLLQSEPEGVNNERIGFYGRCMIHDMSLPSQAEVDLDNFKIKGRQEATCARTEGYMGRKQDGKRYNASYRSKGKGRCLVSLEQLNAWLHINRKIMSLKPSLNSSISDIEHDFKKEYACYKQIQGWKQLMVYKSGIHALGLYTCLLIQRGAMVVEYVGEIVGLRVADKREIEYQSGRKLQYKSACYFFRVDKEQIVDATRKGGIARFVNHSCTPNCVAKIITIRNEKKVVFFAQREIYPGEEITYDYHFNNEDEGIIQSKFWAASGFKFGNYSRYSTSGSSCYFPRLFLTQLSCLVH